MPFAIGVGGCVGGVGAWAGMCVGAGWVALLDVVVAVSTEAVVVLVLLAAIVLCSFHATRINAIEDHHPDLKVSYAKCTVRFNTHDVQGISVSDFFCAAKVDALLD
jgi:hypothetical protein